MLFASWSTARGFWRSIHPISTKQAGVHLWYQVNNYTQSNHALLDLHAWYNNFHSCLLIPPGPHVAVIEPFLCTITRPYIYINLITVKLLPLEQKHSVLIFRMLSDILDIPALPETVLRELWEHNMHDYWLRVSAVQVHVSMMYNYMQWYMFNSTPRPVHDGLMGLI